MSENILDAAIAALGRLGLVANRQRQPVAKEHHHADAHLQIGKGRTHVKYAAECKRNLPIPTLGAVLMQLRRAARAEKRTPLLVTDHVTPMLAARLRAEGQQFADAAGNAFLEGPNFLIYVTGQKPARMPPAERPGRAFTIAGLKVLFALLCNPERVRSPLRNIAAAAGVALGAIPPILADLERSGHVLASNRKRRLYATRRLLDEWAAAYARTLRPKTLKASYDARAFDQWKDWNLFEDHVHWGGEPAANLLVGHLRPGILTLYTPRLPPRLAVEQRLNHVTRPSEARVLEIRTPFWGDTMTMDAATRTVPPVLVYADLLATGDSRCIETAELVYEQHIARLLPHT
jgi:hypothetical protein